MASSKVILMTRELFSYSRRNKDTQNKHVQVCNDKISICYRRGFRRISGFPVLSDPPPPRVNSCLRVHVTSFARQWRQPRAVLWRLWIVYFYRRARVAASESREDSFTFLPQSEQDSRAARDGIATLLAARGVAGHQRGLSEEDNGAIEQRGGEHQRL